MTGWKLHERITPYITDAGLHGVARFGTIAIHHVSVITLVEPGGATDPHILPSSWWGNRCLTGCRHFLRLRIDGRPVINPVMQDVQATCHELCI